MTVVEDEPFAHFVATVGERVRRALVAFYGVDLGADAAADALAVAWERWDKVSAMENAGGYLFRIGQSRARRSLRRLRPPRWLPSAVHLSETNPSAIDAMTELSKLPRVQRAAVLLVKSYGLTYREAAELIDVSEAAITNHVHRGLVRLRSRLEVQ